MRGGVPGSLQEKLEKKTSVGASGRVWDFESNCIVFYHLIIHASKFLEKVVEQ